jgi:hypothetical protein
MESDACQRRVGELKYNKSFKGKVATYLGLK